MDHNKYGCVEGAGPLEFLTHVNICIFLKEQTNDFLGLPLNQISAQEVVKIVASFSIHHKQDYLDKLLVTWEYISALLLHSSCLLIFSSVLEEQRALKREGLLLVAWKNVFVFFLYIYIQQVRI